MMHKKIGLSVAVFALASGVALAQDVVTYYHTDVTGSPIAASDANGNILWREDYTPYGDKRLVQSSPITNRRWYSGHPHEDDTGLTYAGARHYDPLVGRFMGADPVAPRAENHFSFNRYAYANNNPYAYVDPTGNSGELVATGCAITAEVGCVPGALVGAVVEGAIYVGIIYWGYKAGQISNDGEVNTPWAAHSGESNGDSDKSPGDDLKFDKPGLADRLKERGWGSEQGVRDVVNDPVEVGVTRDERGARSTPDGVPRDDPATAYKDRDGGYAVVNDRTKEVVQVSDKNDPDWKTDSRIVWKPRH